MKRTLNIVIVLSIFHLCMVLMTFYAAPVLADIRLPHIFSDHMVLQQDQPIKIWGWADIDENVTVKLNSSIKKVRADKNGMWMVSLPAMKADKKHHTVMIKGKNSMNLSDVMIGEVWICSGQSNMNWPVKQSENALQAIKDANIPDIRLFDVPVKASGLPASDTGASWQVCSPESVQRFSAVGYFFGRELFEALDVPIGLINIAKDATKIEVWTPAEGFILSPALKDISNKIDEADKTYRKQLTEALLSIEGWLADANIALALNTAIGDIPDVPNHPLNGLGKPTALYNGMVHPVIPYGIRGVIWYQGEANRGDGMLYYDKMKALIGGWRNAWKQPGLPFYFVQLAPCRQYRADDLPGLWAAQLEALKIENTGMAVITDISDVTRIHPRNKKDVGKRLSLWALAKTYGKKNIVYSGPLYKSMMIKGSRIFLRFDHVADGLASRDGKPLDWFQIAGKDRRFVDAIAEIKDDMIVVYSDQIMHPVAVRFGWHKEAQPNFINKSGLPASPFFTGE